MQSSKGIFLRPLFATGTWSPFLRFLGRNLPHFGWTLLPCCQKKPESAMESLNSWQRLFYRILLWVCFLSKRQSVPLEEHKKPPFWSLEIYSPFLNSNFFAVFLNHWAETRWPSFLSFLNFSCKLASMSPKRGALGLDLKRCFFF